MAVICVSWENAHRYGEAWISHHRLRYRMFIERQSWEISSYNGLEYDQFDTPAAKYLLWVDDFGCTRGSVRLIPTTTHYMIPELWPDLLNDGPVCSDAVWEASRFGCDHSVSPLLRRKIVGELIQACQEFALARDITGYLGVMPISIFSKVMIPAGCVVKMLGASRKLGRHVTGAAFIEVSRYVLKRVHAYYESEFQVLEDCHLQDLLYSKSTLNGENVIASQEKEFA